MRFAILALILSLLGCTTPKPKPAPTPAPPPPIALPEGVALIEDPAERHNQRLLAFSNFFAMSTQGYERTHGTLPADLTTLIDSGYLWLLPDVPRPHRYEYLQNLAGDSDPEPYWRRLTFAFTPDRILFSAYPLAPGHPLDNATGLTPARSTIIKPSTAPPPMTPEALAQALADPTIAPALRLDLLRVSATDPALRLAIHLYDSLTILPDHYTRLNGRLPANFGELLQGEFEITDPLRSMMEPPAEGAALAAVVDFFLVPSEHAFVRQISIQQPAELEIRANDALVLDGGTSELPRLSEFLALQSNPLARPDFDFSAPSSLLKLYIPADLATLPKRRAAAEMLDLGTGQVLPSEEQNAPDS